MINNKRVRIYCLGKEYVNIDDVLLAQNISPDTYSRKEVASLLVDFGWVRDGRRNIDGITKSVWKKHGDKRRLELEIIRLELLEKRQTFDLYSIEHLREMGFSNEQCLEYIRMLYNTDLDNLHIVTDEEKEAIRFAEKIEEIVDTQLVASRLMWSAAYVFYCDKYFHFLRSEEKYIINLRKVNAELMYIGDASWGQVEWNALKFKPHFLDLGTKLTAAGDVSDFRQFLADNFLTKRTIDKFFKDGIDWLLLAGMCSTARRLVAGEPFVIPYGMDKKLAEKIYKYLENLKEEYG